MYPPRRGGGPVPPPVGGGCWRGGALFSSSRSFFERPPHVRMLSTRGQYAWGQDVGVVANGAKYYSSSSHQRLNVEHPSSSWFCQWLVGVTDGDGSFSVIRQNGKWNLAFQIGQSSYNLRLLYYIKRMLGVGSVTVEQKTGMASYRIRDRRALAISIFPLFDRYPLLTTKNSSMITSQSIMILFAMNLFTNQLRALS